jgi:hypothetical protein
MKIQVILIEETDAAGRPVTCLHSKVLLLQLTAAKAGTCTVNLHNKNAMPQHSRQISYPYKYLFIYCLCVK